MGDFTGEHIPGRRAEETIRNVLMQGSRGAIILLLGVAVWGFNKLDNSITKLNEAIYTIVELQGRHDERIKWHDERIRSLENARLGGQRP